MTKRLLPALLVLLGVMCLTAGGPLDAGQKKGEKGKKVELTGTLKTGIVAIGGETTGTVLQTKEGAYELALPKNLSKEAEKLSGKTVTVTGTLNVRKGVEVKQRRIVEVQTIKAAEDKK